ncbi:MAG: plastocyanin/azurin family copper-binding protein [Thermoplasmata archaeon]
MSTAERRDRRGFPRHRRPLEMSLSSLFLLLAVLIAFVLNAPLAEAQLSRSLELRDALAFEPGSFSAEPGANVTLHLVNGGVLPHTFTLFAEADVSVPVDDNAALQEFYGRSATLVDVALEGAEETTVSFTVPAEEGIYTFVCVVPGHSVGGMHGLIFVGVGPPPGGIGIGIVQGIFLIALVGVLVFAVVYHVRSTRS